MNPVLQRILIWGGSIVALGGLVWGLASLSGDSGPSATSSLQEPPAAADHVRGSLDAPAVLVEYSDFQCPACKAYQPIIKQVLGKYGDRLALVYRHFPLTTLHPYSQLAAKASEAAERQGKFWEFHDFLFDRQESWPKENDVRAALIGYAKELGLNEAAFTADLDSSAVSDRVQRDVTSGFANNVAGTPTFYLNGKLISNPRSVDELSARIDDIVASSTNQ